MSDYSDLTNLTELLKNVYGQGLTNQFNDEKTTYNLFPKSDRKPTGNGYSFGLRYARTQSTGGRAESAKLPDPLTGKKDQGTIVPRYLYGTIRITGPAVEIAKGNAGAFVDGLADEIDDIYKSIVVDMNRQSHWDGFGKLATVSASFAPSTTTTYAVTFDNDMGITYLMEGQLVDFYVAAGTTPITTCCGQRIRTITPSTKVVVFETSGQTFLTNHPNSTIAGYTNDTTAVASGVVAVKMGARDASWASTDTPTEITGLEGLFDAGDLLASFENITVSTNPKWAANIMSNSSVNRPLSIDLMLNALDLTRIRSGETAKQVIMGLGQRRNYANLLLPDVRFAPAVLKGGYETITFAGGDGTVQMVIDPMAQPNKMYFMPDGIVQKYEVASLGWGNLDGDRIHRRSGYDEWDMFLRIYANLGCEQRNCLTKITDLTEPSLY